MFRICKSLEIENGHMLTKHPGIQEALLRGIAVKAQAGLLGATVTERP